LLATLLPHIGTEAVVVLDAAAIGATAGVRPELRPFRGRLVMTPNKGEAEDLVGRDADAVAVARAEEAVVSMDGLVAVPDGRSWLASRRLPGLGTSGSGDVLAGLVAGSAARSGDAAQAACWATYLHVAAGAEASREIGPLGFLARDLLPAIPRLMAETTNG
jgi:NAD(P)H-hydrate repair Nnr-like enzyme with NAD(P)H-hydrate dehydratase domain